MKPIRILGAVLIIVISPAVVVHGQKQEIPVEENLYYRALLASMEANLNAYGNGKIAGRDFRKVIVGRDLFPLEHVDVGKFPTEIKSFHVEYLNPPQLIERYKKLGNDFPFVVVRAMRNEGDRIKIGVTDYWFSYKKKRIGFALEGGVMVTFRYECEKRQFVIEDVRLWGI